MSKGKNPWKRVVDQLSQQNARKSPGQQRELVERGPEILPPRRSKNLVEAVREASEKSAKRVLTDAFDEKRSDLEEMAVRALRRSIEEEGDRLERLIEKSIEVKKREVRLSLLVLLVATTLYVILALTLG